MKIMDLVRKKKGITGDMMMWFLITIGAVIATIIISLFITRSTSSMDQGPGSNPFFNLLPLVLLFKKRKLN